MLRGQKLRLITLSVLAVLSLSSCAAADQVPTVGYGPTPVESDSAGEPRFAGPWADKFAEAYRRSTTEKQRAVLSDGTISDQEYAELRNDFVKCAANFGAIVRLELGGGFTVELGSLTAAQVNDSVVPTCETQTVGYVGALYEVIALNPNRQDEATLVVACLRKSGLVDDAYSPAQFKNDQANNVGLNWNDPKVVACVKDPLGSQLQH